ncbi:hypothetical protein BDW42DRAFT_89397 [Aspergillus taichungensis]|uniref:Uncharacterized protein n=1 Tax=Aspergillus taichungensis TaxID=482145 RepID=A0A2J5HWE9_9EURO|nr:hypothetical protein BDW42DRAFT_89397 [Aspergillus taichungensis]
MVKILPLLTLLAAAATSVEACKQTCKVSSKGLSSCSYKCKNVCDSYPTKDARDDFLANLQSAGHSCTAVSTNGVKCKKTKSFGDCGSHHWSCGSGC